MLSALNHLSLICAITVCPLPLESVGAENGHMFLPFFINCFTLLFIFSVFAFGTFSLFYFSLQPFLCFELNRPTGVLRVHTAPGKTTHTTLVYAPTELAETPDDTV